MQQLRQDRNNQAHCVISKAEFEAMSERLLDMLRCCHANSDELKTVKQALGMEEDLKRTAALARKPSGRFSEPPDCGQALR